MLRASVPSLTQNLMVLESREAILSLAPLLAQLASRCGQPGALHWLPYFLDQAVTRHRLPRLVLLLRPEDGQNCSLTADDLEGAALFFEYQLCGVRTGLVSTGDAVGFSSVIAPGGQRAQVAAAAARALVERGAMVVLATYACAGEPDTRSTLAGWPGVLWAARSRSVGRTLRLQPTLEATLARMGKSTRFNLRYYRRRLQKQVPCEYIADAAPLLRDADLDEINAASLNPVSPEEFSRRVESASNLPGSFLTGLRAGDGRWLSLAGGWRQDGTTVLHWQSNRAGLERHSIGTVMRSFLLEAEIARGARHLLIFGGTPHTMRHAFDQEAVADLIVQKKGLHAAALRRAAYWFSLHAGLWGRANFLADLLSSPALQWAESPAFDGKRRAMSAVLAGSRKAA